VLQILHQRQKFGPTAYDHYALNNGTKDKEQDEIIFKIGHLEKLNNNILLGYRVK
jgi:hypothetical protein